MGEFVEIVDVLAMDVGQVGELVHDADDAAVVRRRQPDVGHGGDLGVDKPWIDTVAGEDPAEHGGESGEDGAGGGERHEKG